MVVVIKSPGDPVMTRRLLSEELTVKEIACALDHATKGDVLLMQTGPNGASSALALCLVEVEHTLGPERVPTHHRNSTDRTA